MEIWVEVRRRVLAGEISKREACREYGLHWDTLQKILAHDEPPGYQFKRPRAKPALGPFLPTIHQILEADRQAPKKQRHTARRIFDRLREEHGYTGCESIVRAAVADWKKTTAEVFVPLSHPPGEAQVDFGFAEVVVAGERVIEACSLGRDPVWPRGGSVPDPVASGLAPSPASGAIARSPSTSPPMRPVGRAEHELRRRGWSGRNTRPGSRFPGVCPMPAVTLRGSSRSF